jgi:hypothetical protein
MDYARIQDGTVMEVIAAFSRTESDRPPAPVIKEGVEPTAAQLAMQGAHDNFAPGEVPIEQRFSPEIVVTLAPIPEGVTVEPGYVWDGEMFSAPAPYVAPAVTAEETKAHRDALLGEAAVRMAPLLDAVELGEATDAETALLKQWRQYRVALSRIETQTGFPADVQWPEVPA